MNILRRGGKLKIRFGIFKKYGKTNLFKKPKIITCIKLIDFKYLTFQEILKIFVYLK